MSIFQDLLKDSSNLTARIEEFEASCDPQSEQWISPLVGTEDGGRWYRVRRLTSYLIWDIYTASAIAHYRRNKTDATAPLLKETGVVTGTLPIDMAERLEQVFFQCPAVPWKDTRPAGYSFWPFNSPGYFGSHEQVTIHRTMTPDMGLILTEALTLQAPKIESIMGHYWTAGAVRVYSARPNKDGGFHTDHWPLGIKKIMIYPSGADSEKGTTEFILPDGKKQCVEGDKGVWAVFENSLRTHRAKAPQKSERPTIELAIIPSFQTDPVVRLSGIHVGYPWLPPDLDSLTGDTCAASFTADEVKERTFLRMLLLGTILPKDVELPGHFTGLGVYDI